MNDFFAKHVQPNSTYIVLLFVKTSVHK